MDSTRNPKGMSSIGLAVDVSALAMLTALAWALVAVRDESGRGLYLACSRVHTWSCAIGLLYLVAAAARKHSVQGHAYSPDWLGILRAVVDAVLAIALGLWLLGGVYGTTSEINDWNIVFYLKLTNIIFILIFIILTRIAIRLMASVWMA